MNGLQWLRMVPASAPTHSDAPPPGVSFVIPVYNAGPLIERMISAVQSQDYRGPVEIIAVDDGSTDQSIDRLQAMADRRELRLLHGEGRGAAAAMNRGIRETRHPFIAQIDQDVIPEREWLRHLVTALADPLAAAAQGHYVADRNADLWARVMGLDLRQRYAAMPRPYTNHVCTGNSVYRASMLHEVGLFDEALGYGYDNDLSYRLTRRGYRLIFCPAATSVHVWRHGAIGYARQQYGFGYGRLDLLSKHRTRFSGDNVSPALMMGHAPLTLLGCTLLLLAAGLAAFGAPWRLAAVAGGGLLAALALERLTAGLTATVRFRDRAGLWFAPVHMVRNIAWSLAIVIWTLRRLLGQPVHPTHSMPPRSAGRDPAR
jgi:hypothetical protein